MKKLCSYLFIFLCSFFIFSISKLYASVVSNSVLEFNYNDRFVVENHNSNFFGEDGYLEMVREEIDRSGFTSPYTIYFSKHDICVTTTHNSTGSSVDNAVFNFYYDYSTSNVFYSVRHTYESSCMSDLTAPSIGNFLSFLSQSFSSGNGLSTGYCSLNPRNEIGYGGCPSLPRVSYNLSNFSGKMNFYDFGFNDYLIPYYYSSNTSTYYAFSCSSNSYLCPEKIKINSNIANVKGFNSDVEFFQSYYDLYGFQEPKNNMEPITGSFELYNNAFIIDYDKLNGTSSSFSFKVTDGVEPVIDNIDYYGVVNDNGLMHFEKISNSDITNFIYTTTFSNRVFTLSFGTNSLIYNDYVYSEKLSKFEKIYVKINYEDPVKYNKDSFKTTLGLTRQIVFNDVCSECLFVQLDSSGSNTYLFSANKDFDTSKIYFSDVISNDFLYNEFNYIDLNSKVLLDNLVNYSNRQYYYGIFNKILFDNVKLSLSTGLINSLFQVVNDQVESDPQITTSGSYQMLYFITPNIYWGNGVYTADRSTVNGSFVDSDGNKENISISGDFTNHRSNLVNNLGISGLFKSAFEKGKEFVNCSVEILSLVTSLFNSFPTGVQALILLIFFISLIYVLVRFIS